jgi:quinol monooxygenase YgiN
VAIPNKVEELKAILLGLIEPTRLEAGVIKYELLQNQSEPTDFTFVEEWESTAALDTHLASPHVLFSNSQARRINIAIRNHL